MTLPAPEITHVKSPARGRKAPLLSILIPYYRDDPAGALTSLLEQTGTLKSVEILLYDDGTGDPDLCASTAALVKDAASPVHLLIAEGNRGRAYARNSLKSHARADWVLFLDADMRPVTSHFIEDYLSLIKAEVADIIFGGFKVPSETEDPERELHRAFSEVSDCLTLQDRQRHGPQYVCSSNLCVKKSVIDAEPFDPEFNGWGWEDSEWAARAGKAFSLVHADIPAMHLGLETTDTLLRRFKDSGPNYLRFTNKHPELAKTLTLYNVTQRLQRIPGHKLLRPVLKGLVKSRFVPTNLRLNALKLWRASWYAESFS